MFVPEDWRYQMPCKMTMKRYSEHTVAKRLVQFHFAIRNNCLSHRLNWFYSHLAGSDQKSPSEYSEWHWLSGAFLCHGTKMHNSCSQTQWWSKFWLPRKCTNRVHDDCWDTCAAVIACIIASHALEPWLHSSFLFSSCSHNSPYSH